MINESSNRLARRTYTPEEVAEILGVPITRVRAWLREGHLEGIKVSRSWLIPVSAVDDMFTPPKDDETKN